MPSEPAADKPFSDSDDQSHTGPVAVGIRQRPVLPPLDLREGRPPTTAGVDIGLGGAVDERGYRRVDNITDEIVALYKQATGTSVSKDDVFHYVYGLLHDPAYRRHLRRRPAQDAPPHPHAVEPASGSPSWPRPAGPWPTCTSSTNRSSRIHLGHPVKVRADPARP